MHDDTLMKLGTVRAQDEGRDAVHIAVLTIQAQERFVVPPIGNLWVTAHGTLAYSADDAVGIMDPFLPRGLLVEQGQWFYVYLKPGSISGLRHVWDHAMFPTLAPVIPVASSMRDVLISKAEVRVREWCSSLDAYGFDYHTCIELFEEGESGSFSLGPGDTSIYSGDEASGEIPSAILDDIELIIGKPLKARPEWFRCAC